MRGTAAEKDGNSMTAQTVSMRGLVPISAGDAPDS